MNSRNLKYPYIVFGIGKTGMSLVRFLVKNKVEFAVVDTRINPPELEVLSNYYPAIDIYCGLIDLDLLTQAKEIYVSPGVSLLHPGLQAALSKGVTLSGDIDLFSRTAQSPIIAITGSNGKTTVTTLVAKMAESSGLKIAVGGNIGTPALDIIRDDVDLYVIEVSSFQLERTNSLKAEIVTILNISEDHMDHYSSLKDYHLAKRKIFKASHKVLVNQEDSLTFPTKEEKKDTWLFTLAKHIDITNHSTKVFHVKEKNGIRYLAFNSKTLLPIRKLKITGQHNQANSLAALALGHAVGIPLRPMIDSLLTFTGLPHRCQFVRRIRDVDYYNDSKATNIGAVIAAINSLAFSNSGRIVLIAGGISKNSDFSRIYDLVKKHCRAVILIGKDSPFIYKVLHGASIIFQESSLSSAVNRSCTLAQAKDSVLLSPACSSFDMYRNYEERGEDFIQLVESLK